MAFIRRSGINPLISSLRRHCENGKPLRILTTVYTGSTEQAALEQLTDLGAQVRISDVSTTRLHAKAWIFHRRSGFRPPMSVPPTSLIPHSSPDWSGMCGPRPHVTPTSSTNSRQSSRATGRALTSSPLMPRSSRLRAAAPAPEHDTGPNVILSPIELRLEPFQERLLEKISLSRSRGYHRNLLVAATGTGKTVMAAVDYARLRDDLPRARLLFVAHRNEILDQSLAIFRHAIRDASFGEKWIGGARPQHFEHVFASVQSLNAANLEDLAPDHFDVVVVDEFHHAAARRTASCLTTSHPRTARPDRDTRTQRRPVDPALVRRPHRRRVATVGCHRPAAPLPLHVFRHSRRPGPHRHPVAPRPGLRRHGPQQPVHQYRRLGADGRRKSLAWPTVPARCGHSVSASASSTPSSWQRTSPSTAFRPWRCGVTVHGMTGKQHLKTSPPTGSASCSRWTCSTRVSMSPRLTHC